MKYPKLVPEAVCKTPCEVVLFAEGITEDGAHKTAFSGSLKCLFQSSSKRVKTDKDEEVTLSGEAFFASDFCPELPEIPDGEMTVLGVKRSIVTGQKARDPDGSVNYIRLGVK